MATYYSQGNGPWSTLSNWDTNPGGDGSDPASVAAMDDNTFVIQAGHAIEYDITYDQVDTEWSVGIAGITITGHATGTPGMLYAKYSADGKYYLKVKSGTTIAGTNVTVTTGGYGRLLANNDGAWGTTTGLAWNKKFIIELLGTTTPAYLDTLYLDVRLYCATVTNKWVRTYGTKATVTFTSGTPGVVNWTSHGLPNSMNVWFRGSGTLPAPLQKEHPYYVLAQTTNEFKLSLYPSGSAYIAFDGTGSGTIECLSGHNTGDGAVFDVIEDVSADAQWLDADAVVTLADCTTPSAIVDLQRNLTISSLGASSITLSAAADSVQGAGAKIVLVTRNVAIRSRGTGQNTNFVYGQNGVGSLVFDCELRMVDSNGASYGVRNTYDSTFGPNSVVQGFYYGCTYGGGNVRLYGTVVGLNVGAAYSGMYFTGTAIAAGAGYGMNLRCDGAWIEGAVYGAMNSSINGEYHNTTFYGCYVAFNNQQGACRAQNCDFVGTLNLLVDDSTVRFENCRIYGAATGEVSFTSATGMSTVTRSAVLFRNCRIYGGDLVEVSTLQIAQQDQLDASDAEHFAALEDSSAEGTQRIYWMYGDCLKNVSEVRGGGADNSIEVTPTSNCGAGTDPFKRLRYLPIFEWTEVAVPASAQTRTVYMKGTGWSTNLPADDELWFEAEYFDSASDLDKTTVRTYDTAQGDQTLSVNDAWEAFTLSFTPGRVGMVRYRAYLLKYVSAAKLYVDNALYTS